MVSLCNFFNSFDCTCMIDRLSNLFKNIFRYFSLFFFKIFVIHEDFDCKVFREKWRFWLQRFSLILRKFLVVNFIDILDKKIRLAIFKTPTKIPSKNFKKNTNFNKYSSIKIFSISTNILIHIFETSFFFKILIISDIFPSIFRRPHNFLELSIIFLKSLSTTFKRNAFTNQRKFPTCHVLRTNFPTNHAFIGRPDQHFQFICAITRRKHAKVLGIARSLSTTLLFSRSFWSSKFSRATLHQISRHFNPRFYFTTKVVFLTITLNQSRIVISKNTTGLSRERNITAQPARQSFLSFVQLVLGDFVRCLCWWLALLQSFVDFAYAGRETLLFYRAECLQTVCAMCLQFGLRTLYFHYQRDEPEMCVAYVKSINARLQRVSEREREKDRNFINEKINQSINTSRPVNWSLRAH